MSMGTKVTLISDNSNYPDIQVQTEELIIGRNAQTKIKETRCAREQGVIVYVERYSNEFLYF